MHSRDRSTSLYRLLGSGLAATGLLGHGIAMLLVAVLAPAPAEAGPAPFGDICTADGLVEPPGREDDRAPTQGGHLNACPVCTAYAQSAQAALPAVVALPGAIVAAAAPAPAPDALPPTAAALVPQSRGPPSAS